MLISKDDVDKKIALVVTGAEDFKRLQHKLFGYECVWYSDRHHDILTLSFLSPSHNKDINIVVNNGILTYSMNTTKSDTNYYRVDMQKDKLDSNTTKEQDIKYTMKYIHTREIKAILDDDEKTARPAFTISGPEEFETLQNILFELGNVWYSSREAELLTMYSFEMEPNTDIAIVVDDHGNMTYSLDLARSNRNYYRVKLYKDEGARNSTKQTAGPLSRFDAAMEMFNEH